MPKPTLQTRFGRSAAALTALAASATAWAHEGHGMEGGHWHATDIWGLLAIAAAAALYYHRRK
jgi:hypothetical protein